MEFAVPADHWIKLKESEKKFKYIDFPTEVKKTMEHESDGDSNWNWSFSYNHQLNVQELEEL